MKQTKSFKGEEKTLDELNRYSSSQLAQELGNHNGVNYSDGIDQTEFELLDDFQSALGSVSYDGDYKDIQEINDLSANQLQNEFGTIEGVDYSDGVNAAEFQKIQQHQESESSADTVTFKGKEYTMHELTNKFTAAEMESEFGSIPGVNLQDGVLDAGDFKAVDDAQAQSGTVLFEDDPISLKDLNEEKKSDLRKEFGHIDGVNVNDGINLEEFKIIQKHQAGKLAHVVDEEQLQTFIDIGVFAPAEIEAIAGEDRKVNGDDYNNFVAMADGADGSRKDGVITTSEIEAWKAKTEDYKEFTPQAYIEWYIECKVSISKGADLLGDYFKIEDNYGSVNAVDYVNNNS